MKKESILLIFILALLIVNIYILEGGNNPMMSGAFFQLDGSYNIWSTLTWESKLNDMKNIGMDTVIIQFSAWDSYSYYNSSLSYITTEYTNIIPRLMQAAANQGIKVYVATYYDSNWFSDGTNSAYLALNATRNSNVIDELVDKIGVNSYSSFAGWYIPYEIDDYTFVNEPYKSRVIDFYNRIVNYCKIKTPGKPVIAAPFFGKFMSPSLYESYWKDLLSGIQYLDILALQDGIGVNHTTFTDIGPYFNALRNACVSYGRTLWDDLESFDTNSEPADIDRVKEQLLLSHPYVEKAVTYEYFHYMDKSGFINTTSATLYNNYLNYYNSICTDTNYPIIETEVTPYNGDDTKLELIFNEKINMVIASIITNYSINGEMYPTSISADHANMKSVILTFPYIPADYNLILKNIEDLYGNKVPDISSASSNTLTNSSTNNIEDIGIYPNPCYLSHNNKIMFYLKKENVEIDIYNLYAEKIYQIKTDEKGIAEWDFVDFSGNIVRDGIYFYVAPDLNRKGTFVLMK